MKIGEEDKPFWVEPIEDPFEHEPTPVETPEPVWVPAPVREPEKVPAGV